FLLGRFELPAHVVLFADENQLPRGRVIFIFEEIMHPETKVVQIELTEVFATDGEWIKIVLFKVPAKLAAALFVFSPNETGDEKDCGCDDRRNHVNSDVVRGNHR